MATDDMRRQRQHPLIRSDMNSIVRNAAVKYYNELLGGNVVGKDDVGFLYYGKLVLAVQKMKVNEQNNVICTGECKSIIEAMRRKETEMLKSKVNNQTTYLDLASSAVAKVVDGIVRSRDFRDATGAPIDIHTNSNLYKDVENNGYLGKFQEKKFMQGGGGTAKVKPSDWRRELTRRVRLIQAAEKKK